MANKKWFYDAQDLFKKWKKDNHKSSETFSQNITPDVYRERVFVYPRQGGSPVVYELVANRHTDEVYLMPSVGIAERVYLRKAKPIEL